MKHAIFAERVAPLLADAKARAYQPLSGLPKKQYVEAARDKAQAAIQMQEIRAVLYPEDESDG